MTTAKVDRPLRTITTYPRDAILETAHLAEVLGVCETLVQRMDLPCFYVGTRVRYIWGQVFDALTERANADARPLPLSRRRRVG